MSEQGKWCVNCRFYGPISYPHLCYRNNRIAYEKANEENDKSPSRKRNRVTGEWERIAYVHGGEPTCEQARQDENSCGLSGKWFEKS